MPKAKMKEITLLDWTKAYDKQAKIQGWSLFDADGTILIHKIDDQKDAATSNEELEIIEKTHKQLESDSEAINIITEQAAQGCNMSLSALWLDGKKSYEAPRKLAKHFMPSKLRIG